MQSEKYAAGQCNLEISVYDVLHMHVLKGQQNFRCIEPCALLGQPAESLTGARSTVLHTFGTPRHGACQ